MPYSGHGGPLLDVLLGATGKISRSYQISTLSVRSHMKLAYQDKVSHLKPLMTGGFLSSHWSQAIVIDIVRE